MARSCARLVGIADAVLACRVGVALKVPPTVGASLGVRIRVGQVRITIGVVGYLERTGTGFVEIHSHDVDPALKGTLLLDQVHPIPSVGASGHRAGMVATNHARVVDDIELV